MKNTPVIEIKNMTKDYGSARGVFDISFNVYQGECFGFLGPNGAGKSTTIRHIMGFSAPDKGSIKVFGLDARKDYAKILPRVGYVPGEIALPSGLNGYQFLEIQQSLTGIKNDSKKNELIEYFHLTPAELKVETKRMSLGIKRKLAIVAAFMSDPELLILDEPTSGLDHEMMEKFITLIKEEHQKGKTILLSSHIFSEVDATCTRVDIIKEGKIVSEISSTSLKNASTQSYTIEFDSLDNLLLFKEAHPELIYFQIEKKNCLFFAANDSSINSLLKDIVKYGAISFSNKKESLQDYFMKFYSSDRKFEEVK